MNDTRFPPILYGIIAPAVLGLLVLALVVLPGDADTGRILAGLAVYLLVVIGGSILINRRLKR